MTFQKLIERIRENGIRSITSTDPSGQKYTLLVGQVDIVNEKYICFNDCKIDVGFDRPMSARGELIDEFGFISAAMVDNRTIEVKLKRGSCTLELKGYKREHMEDIYNWIDRGVRGFNVRPNYPEGSAQAECFEDMLKHGALKKMAALTVGSSNFHGPAHKNGGGSISFNGAQDTVVYQIDCDKYMKLLSEAK